MRLLGYYSLEVDRHSLWCKFRSWSVMYQTLNKVEVLKSYALKNYLFSLSVTKMAIPNAILLIRFFKPAHISYSRCLLIWLYVFKLPLYNSVIDISDWQKFRFRSVDYQTLYPSDLLKNDEQSGFSWLKLGFQKLELGFKVSLIYCITKRKYILIYTLPINGLKKVV